MNVIAILGPESTGKTTAAVRLSEKLGALYVEEFARDYLKEIKLNYTEGDILRIAQGQIALEKSAIENHPKQTIILDTELITIEVWLEFYNYNVPSWIIEHIQSCQYDYILFNTDVAWVDDGLRNNPNDRLFLFNAFKAKLTQYDKNFKIVESLAELDIV